MARIRTIKPELWSDESFAECSTSARLLFVATLNFADDNGNIDRSARQIKAQAFPYDAIDCEPLILELLRVGLFVEYGISDKFYLHVKNFKKHQKIDRPGPARCPIYEDSARIHRIIDEDSTNIRRTDQTPQADAQNVNSASARRAFDPVREGKGREGNGMDTPHLAVGSPEGEGQEATKGPKATATRRKSTASRIPTDFKLTEERQAYAANQGIDPAKTHANFVDYWTAAAGQNARKYDWEATWRMWCRRESERSKGKSGVAKSRYEQLTAGLYGDDRE